MSWNYRIFKTILPDGDEYFSIREVFCNKNGKIIYVHSKNPIDLSAETIDGLKWIVEECLKSLGKPILNEEEVIFVDKGDDV